MSVEPIAIPYSLGALTSFVCLDRKTGIISYQRLNNRVERHFIEAVAELMANRVEGHIIELRPDRIVAELMANRVKGHFIELMANGVEGHFMWISLILRTR